MDLLPDPLKALFNEVQKEYSKYKMPLMLDGTEKFPDLFEVPQFEP